jgi:microcystin-dependent protein
MGKFARVFAFSFCVAFTNAQADTTGTTGGDVPFDNMQPSLVVTEALLQYGLYPGGGVAGGTLGFVYNFAGNFAPGSSLDAQGQLLDIASNTALYSILGTTYGGDGRSTFALPNLAGSAMIGAGMGLGLTNRVLGSEPGTPTVSLSAAQLPSHTHTLSGAETGETGATGSGQSFNNMQPSLTLKRLIAVSGEFPSPGAGSAFLG